MKNKVSIFLIFFITTIQSSFGQELKEEYQVEIESFIKLIKNDDKERIAELVKYPLKRDNPIPSIRNKEEFMLRYHEIFDDSLKSLIIHSNTSTDWSEVGWRGIMLYNGTMWIDYDGKILAVNYQSIEEKTIKKNLIAANKNTLHSSLINFKNPVCILETQKFRIRIDELSNGKYRYASWPISKSMSESPDIILTNGEVIMEGSGGNHTFKFKNGMYVYECSINKIREKDASPANLIVYKNNIIILSQVAVILQ